MRVAFVVALLVCLLAVADAKKKLRAPSPVPFTLCDPSAPYKVAITSITADPFPPVKGGDITVDVQGKLSEQVTAGTYEIDVNFMGIQLLKKTGDLCTLSPKFPCPQAAGPIDLSQTLNIPAIAPSGDYDIQVSGNDQAGNVLLCVKLSLNMPQLALEDEEEEEEAMVVPAIADPQPVPWQKCDASAKYLVDLKTVTADPFPPVKGQDITVKVAGSLLELVTAATYEIDVSFDGIQLLTKTGDLCTLSPAFTCPHPAGDITVSETLNIPSIAPSGSYDITVKGNDQSGNALMCATLHLDMP